MSFCSILQDKIKSSQNEIEVLLKNGKAEVCLMKISRALVLDPHNVTFHYLRGEAFLLLGEHMLAIKSITKALRLEPSDSLQEKLAFAYCYFGDFLYGKEQYQEALINYKLANGLLPKFFSQCISCHIHLREYQNAMSVIEYALSLGITTELLVARAKLFLLFGNTARCYEDVHHSLELEPTCEEGLQLMDKLEKLTSTAQRKALDYCLIKSRKEALRQMNLAIDSHPHDANHYILRGEIHRESNLFSEAIDDFLLAMDKCGHSYDNPLYIEASYELVLTFNSFAVECFKKEHYLEAVELLNKAIKFEKECQCLYINRGDCFYKLNEYHFALNDYEQALDLTKGNFSTALSYRLAVVHFFLGMNNISKNSLLAAEEDFSSAITYSPSTSRFYVCRARTRNLLKKNTEARCDTITALLLDPQSEECLPLISQLFPGYTVNDLLCSEESLEQRLNLQLQFQTRKNSRRFSHHKDRHINQLTAVNEGAIVKPYNFDVLDLPLPETSKQKGIPPLKFCLEEREFHALIYYAKKACTDQLHKFLYH